MPSFRAARQVQRSSPRSIPGAFSLLCVSSCRREGRRKARGRTGERLSLSLELIPIALRFVRDQIITQHEEGEIICEDTNLGFERTNKICFIR
jgi:hypothetical protein